MSFQMMLVASQAAGISLNLWQTSQANKMIGLGADLDRQQLDLRMQQETLASTEQALMNSEKLRNVLATQAAIMGARGQLPGVGSARAIQQGALKEYGADERARQLNLNFRNQQLKAARSLITIEEHTSKAQLGGNLFKTGLDQLSFNSLFSGLQNPNKLNTDTGKL